MCDISRFCQQLAELLNVGSSRIQAAVALLDAGNTIPFIARYRKEATQGLDESQLRQIDDQLLRSRELETRRAAILKSIEQQGKLTDDLRRQIHACQDRRLLEDLYLPFRPAKRTRATIAREKGLQPLADILLRQEALKIPAGALLQSAVSEATDVADQDAALQGACDIVAEVWSQDIFARQLLLEMAKQAELVTAARRGKADPDSKFAGYFDRRERIANMPAHRFLAMQRGADEGVLRIELSVNEPTVLQRLSSHFIRNPSFDFVEALRATVSDCYHRLLYPATSTAIMQQLKERADADAIDVFARNLRELLLAPPAGAQVTIGVDPGFRTGCKLAVVDQTGRFLAGETIYPTPPRNDQEGAAGTMLKLIREYQVTLIAVGNGTASREADQFVTDLIRQHDLQVTKVIVSESGASVYSASELAVREYPQLDVTVRGAISIAHRLQDPLSELVKIEPQSIGVGQYQHDVNQAALKRALAREVESCVNSVGVDVNSASAALLSYVSGIGVKLAERIVAFRDQHGRIETREQLLRISGLGRRAWQQAAGFLRIRNGCQPLDNSAVHPEQYPLVMSMARRLQVDAAALVGNESLVGQLCASEFVQGETGEFTVRDVLEELARPGRDPRREFRIARFSAVAHDIGDLQPGMTMEGVVTNVTRFGAFVDIGVHQDGLIHISQLADRYVQDPAEEVSAGDIVTVRVLEVDISRRRISLSRKPER